MSEQDEARLAERLAEECPRRARAERHQDGCYFHFKTAAAGGWQLYCGSGELLYSGHLPSDWTPTWAQFLFWVHQHSRRRAA